jgi:SAM-dependent methyltransferase
MKVLSEKFSQHAPIMNFPEDQRTFYDLGCGIGRLVLGMAILHGEIRARGIEIVPDRVRQATHAIERLGKGKQIMPRIQITQGSFLDPAVNYGDACWIFLSNLCYDETVQKDIYVKLEAECKKGCVLICSRELPLGEGAHFEKIEQGVNVAMTWSNTSTCVIYRVK